MSFSPLIVIISLWIGNIKCVPSMQDVKSVWSRYTKVSPGDARYYGEYPADVHKACQLDPIPPLGNAPGWIKVAASVEDFLQSVGCGMCIEITGDGTPLDSSTVGTPVKGTLKAIIVDICGGCGQGGFDLYKPGDGVYKTQFKAVECPSLSGPQGNIQFRFRGSNFWYLKIQVRNTKVAIAGLEFLHDNKWHCMERGGNNHFIMNNIGKINFPIKVRLTSISNEQLESSIEKLENEIDLPSKIQFSGFSADSNPEDIKCYGQGGITQGNTKTTPPAQNTATTAAPATTTAPATSNPTMVTTSQSGGGQSTPAAVTNKPTTGQSNPTAKPSTTQPSGAGGGTDNFCKGKQDGQYPDASNLSGYIVCTFGRKIKMPCPTGLMYNKDLKICDWPRNVQNT